MDQKNMLLPSSLRLVMKTSLPTCYVLNINLSDATPAIVTMTDITSLIDEYLEEGSTVQLNEITELIDRYLEQ